MDVRRNIHHIWLHATLLATLKSRENGLGRPAARNLLVQLYVLLLGVLGGVIVPAPSPATTPTPTTSLFVPASIAPPLLAPTPATSTPLAPAPY